MWEPTSFHQLWVQSKNDQLEPLVTKKSSMNLENLNNGEYELGINEDPHNALSTQESIITRKCHPDESLFTFNHPSNIQHPIDPKLEFNLKLRNNYALNLKMSKHAVL